MRDIAALVFGGESREECVPRDEQIFGGHAARPQEWCQTSPGRAALSWLSVMHAARERKRDRGHDGSFGRRIF